MSELTPTRGALYLLRSLIFFSDVLSLSGFKACISSVKFVPKYFAVFAFIVKESFS